MTGTTSTTGVGGDVAADLAADVVVLTPGLTEEEVAAVVSVVRAGIEEELELQAGGDGAVARSALRWRRAVRPALAAALREWR